MKFNESHLHTARVNGLELAYYDVGEGPVVMCYHGFPDTATTWDKLAPALVEAGYRVLAPFLRGYPPSQPHPDGLYTTIELGRDVIGLMDALEVERATLIGHDWGASTVYCAANLAPERISKLVTVGIPHPKALKPTPRLMWAMRHFITFQFKGHATRKFRKNDFAYVDEIVKRWAPLWDFGPEETADIKAAFAKPGAIEAALGYYWNMAASARDKEANKIVLANTSVDAMLIMGSDDAALASDLIERSRQCYTGTFRNESIDGVGHFVHREDPERFNALVLDFLA